MRKWMSMKTCVAATAARLPLGTTRGTTSPYATPSLKLAAHPEWCTRERDNYEFQRVTLAS